MARRKQNSHKRQHRPRRRRVESQRSVATTVAWMLTALVALTAVSAAIVFEIILASTTDQQSPGAEGVMLPNLMWFIALASGIVCLLLTPLVYRYRPAPPPVTITLAVVLIAAAPLLRIAYWLATSRS